MDEVLYEYGDAVLAHQKRDDQHRLVLCCYPPPQEAGEWVSKNELAYVDVFQINWDGDLDLSPLRKQ